MDLSARRVLLCLRYGIGDVVMELPVLKALRRALPQAHITALGASPAIQLLERSRDIDDVISLNHWGITHRWDWGPPGAGRAISAWLDQHDFDLFLDVHHVAPAVGSVVWSRGVRSLEADEAAESAALQRGASGVEAIEEAVRAGWGLEVAHHGVPCLEVPGDAREFARHLLHTVGLGRTKPTAVSPVASLSLKQWPMDRLARVVDGLVEHTDEPVLVFCGPQEHLADVLRRHSRHHPFIVSVGPLHLLHIAALLECCRAFVCNDTGLMHTAGAVGTPTVSVFGPTAPSVYRPPSGQVLSVGGEAVECPHRNETSLHPPACFAAGHCLIAEESCIHSVTEEEVQEVLHELLGGAEVRAHSVTAAM